MSIEVAVQGTGLPTSDVHRRCCAGYRTSNNWCPPKRWHLCDRLKVKCMYSMRPLFSHPYGPAINMFGIRQVFPMALLYHCRSIKRSKERPDIIIHSPCDALSAISRLQASVVVGRVRPSNTWCPRGTSKSFQQVKWNRLQVSQLYVLNMTFLSLPYSTANN